MKKIITVMFIICAGNIFSQWQLLNGINPIWVKAFESNNSFIFAGNYVLIGEQISDIGLGVYRSSNNGNNWSLTSLSNKMIINLHFKNSRIFACTNHEGVYYSDNDGTNWTLLSTPSDMQILASNSSYLFGCSQSGLYSTTNNGVNWITISSGGFNALFVKDNYVYAGNSNSLNISSNNGTNWIQLSLDSKPVYSLAANGTDIYAGTNSGLYKSTNNGTNWMITSLENIGVSSVIAFETNIIAGELFGNRIFKSTNNGVNWIQRNEGIGSGLIETLINCNGYIFAGGSIGLYRRSVQNILGVKLKSEILPNKFSLSQNYPNPFNPVTRINFDLAKKGFVSLKVFDILGREVQTLVNEEKVAGSYSVDFNASDLASGVYFYRIESGGFSDVKRMILIK